MVQINFPKEYGYFWDLASIIINGEDLPVDEINMVGGRKSAKTTTFQLFEALIALSGVDNVGMISMRNSVQDSEQLLDDYINTYQAYELPFSVKNSKKVLRMLNQDIRILGVNDKRVGNVARKSGLSKFGSVKYIIVFFEERFEFSETDVAAMKEAIRSVNPNGEKVQMLYVNACNPWAKNSPYIKYCSKYQTWDINKLKTTGSQIGIYNIPLGDGKYKRALFHYTNWRVAKEYLGESEIKQIQDTWNQDKKRAATTDWGLPGYEVGAIYTHLLNNLGKAIYQEHTYLSGGMDYGWGRDSRSGKTVAHFMGYSENNGIDIYGEYVQDNHTHPKSPDKVANEICKFYYEQMVEYCNRNHWASAFPLRVRVDNAAVGMIQILNTKANQMGLKWLQFVRCKKFNINDRIELTLSAMYRHQIRLGDNVKLLKEEMELSYYEDTYTQKRAKENDHSLNAFEYGIEPFMFKIARENKLTNLSFKFSKL